MDEAPTSYEEYIARFHRNYRTSGFGIENVAMHCPCPFCGAPDNLVVKIIHTEREMKRGATCKECGRSWRAIFTSPSPGATQFEVVQTGGPDQPNWFNPKMRRV